MSARTLLAILIALLLALAPVLQAQSQGDSRGGSPLVELVEGSAEANQVQAIGLPAPLRMEPPPSGAPAWYIEPDLARPERPPPGAAQTA